MTLGANNIVFNTGEPAYAVNRNGRIVAWNKAAANTFGYPESQALDANCWELLAGKDIFGNDYCAARCPHREMALRRKSINRCRMRFSCASGRYDEFTVSAIALFETPGQEYLIHLCRPVAENAGDARPGTVPHRQSAEAGVLTAREMEVLRHLEDGHSTKEIATILTISIPTVRNHIEHILHKLHCHSRLEAVAVARRLDLL